MCVSASSSPALVHRFFWAKQANNLLLIQLIYHLFSFWNNKLILLILLHHDHKPDSHMIFHSVHIAVPWASVKPCPGFVIKLGLVLVRVKVVGHDICALVYFHSIVFCLDFHQGERYLRKRGRKWDENKGRGREPSVMEPVPHWSRFSRRHADSGATAATHGCGHSQSAIHLFIVSESTNNQAK